MCLFCIKMRLNAASRRQAARAAVNSHFPGSMIMGRKVCDRTRHQISFACAVWSVTCVAGWRCAAACRRSTAVGGSAGAHSSNTSPIRRLCMRSDHFPVRFAAFVDAKLIQGKRERCEWRMGRTSRRARRRPPARLCASRRHQWDKSQNMGYLRIVRQPLMEMRNSTEKPAHGSRGRAVGQDVAGIRRQRHQSPANGKRGAGG